MGDWRSSEINISAIKVAGFGGLGMVFVALMLVFELSAARWLLAVGLGGGVLVAVMLALSKRSSGRGRDDPPTGLELRSRDER